MQEQLQIIVAHTLPGRMRLRLSHPSRNSDKTTQIIKSHPGVLSVVYTAETQNLLIHYEPDRIALEEVILRASLSLSTDYQLNSVMIKASEPKTPLSRLSVYAGISLIVGHLVRFFSNKTMTLNTVQLICGLGTTAAVAEHVFLDLKNKGQFHPEVLSIGYLLTSFLRGNLLKGATIAWIMTFARHIMEPPAKMLKLETKAMDPDCNEHHCEYEATITQEMAAEGPGNLLTRLPKLLLGVYSDMNLTLEDRFFQEIQKLSRDHDEVLEGLENLRRGIRLQVVS
jgi:hypothetical protein